MVSRRTSIPALKGLKKNIRWCRGAGSVVASRSIDHLVKPPSAETVRGLAGARFVSFTVEELARGESACKNCCALVQTD